MTLNSFEARTLIGKVLSEKKIPCTVPIARKKLYAFLQEGLPFDINKSSRLIFEKNDILDYFKHYRTPS